MDIAAVILIIIGILILFVMFSPSAEDYEKKIADANEKVTKAQNELKTSIDEVLKNQNHSVEGTETVDLCLDGMIMMSILDFGDIIDTLKNDSHSYLKLIACHMFIEQLSDEFNVSSNNSTFEFADNFLRSKLTESDIQFNMLDEVDEDTGDPYLIIALSPLQERLNSVLRGEELNSYERLNLTIEFCSDIVSLIDDDELIDQFIKKSSEFLKNKNLFNVDSEAAYLSVGV